MAVEKGRQGHTFPPTIFLSIPLFILRLVQSREFYDNYWAHHVKKYPLLLKKLFFTSLCRLLLTRAYAYWLKRVAQNSKIGVMKANQSFCCGFCFEGRSRDEFSTISDFLSDFRTKVYTACHSCGSCACASATRSSPMLGERPTYA